MISRFHYITQDILNFSHSQLAEFACKGGADWVQLRVKNKSFDEWKKIAEETKLICLKYGAKLIVNDNIQIAKEICADGVHLGKEDMNPKEARKILGNNIIIGGSTNTIDDVKKRIEESCDYIGVGPFQFTSTKEKLNPVLGLYEIRKIAEQFGNKIPMIAIGGIKLENIESLMQTGIHGVAVSSAINLVEDKIEATKNFCHRLHRFSQMKKESV
ncbi:MAG: thiamine phosphate synthase [Bacteroidetes bacterium]|nr:thiamine phosphate synthase [Bacteroidota bacterium]